MTFLPDIAVKQLSVEYKTEDGPVVRAIENISLQVFPGEIVSIVGPSGCGKTSILRAILGEVPYSGQADLQVGRSSELSYLQQKPELLPWRTSLENAALGLEVRGLLNRDSLKRVEELLVEFGIDGAARTAFPDELSGGMQQRVAIARALESSPKVLLCDEPFSAIDFINRLKLNGIFKERCNSKASVLFVTHNIDEAIFLSNRIVVMSGSPGRIVDVVTPQFDEYFSSAFAVREHPRFEAYFSWIWGAMSKNERR